MSVTTMLFVPTILFMVIVAPIWITMHYRSKNKMSRGISQEERENLDEMLATLDKLADRVETLESILADNYNDWQNHSNRERGASKTSTRSTGDHIDG